MYICAFGHLIHSAQLRKQELWHGKPCTSGVQVQEVSVSGSGHDDRSHFFYLAPVVPRYKKSPRVAVAMMTGVSSNLCLSEKIRHCWRYRNRTNDLTVRMGRLTTRHYALRHAVVAARTLFLEHWGLGSRFGCRVSWIRATSISSCVRI